MSTLIQELRARSDVYRKQRDAEVEAMRMVRKAGNFMDDMRYITAITQGRRVKA